MFCTSEMESWWPESGKIVFSRDVCWDSNSTFSEIIPLNTSVKIWSDGVLRLDGSFFEQSLILILVLESRKTKTPKCPVFNCQLFQFSDFSVNNDLVCRRDLLNARSAFFASHWQKTSRCDCAFCYDCLPLSKWDKGPNEWGLVTSVLVVRWENVVCNQSTLSLEVASEARHRKGTRVFFRLQLIDQIFNELRRNKDCSWFVCCLGG